MPAIGDNSRGIGGVCRLDDRACAEPVDLRIAGRRDEDERPEGRLTSLRLGDEDLALADVVRGRHESVLLHLFDKPRGRVVADGELALDV